ncbi:hypothetical protein ACFQ4K_31570 [Tistrella bauzanensis]
MMLYGISDGASLALFGSLWPEIYGTRFLGAIRAAVVALMVFASALGPGIGGALIDLGVAFPPRSPPWACTACWCLASCWCWWAGWSGADPRH